MPRKLACLASLCILVGVVLSFTNTMCLAQWVDISREGGVYVRAPFVRVYVDPYGGTSVRAPFTAIDVPGRRFPDVQPPGVIERRVVQPSFPGVQELQAMGDETLRQSLRSTADRLYERLNRFDSGVSWQRYLRLPDEVLTDSLSDSDQRRNALTKLLGRFHYVATEPKYERIADLPAFIAMQAALTEMVSRLDASSAAGGLPDEELPTPDPNRSSRSRSFLKPAPRPDAQLGDRQ